MTPSAPMPLRTTAKSISPANGSRVPALCAPTSRLDVLLWIVTVPVFSTTGAPRAVHDPGSPVSDVQKYVVRPPVPLLTSNDTATHFHAPLARAERLLTLMVDGLSDPVVDQ